MPGQEKVLAVCAGGTGGHIVPALAVVEALQDLGFSGRIVWFHTRRGEHRVLAEHAEINRIAMPLVSPRYPLRFALTLLSSIWMCLKVFRQQSPFGVMATGGYTSLPGVVAARALGIPVALVEVNIVPGRATRWLSRFATITFVPVSSIRLSGRVMAVGVPLRREVSRLNRESARKSLALTESDFVVTITGGSQGARSINNAFGEVLNDLIQRFGSSLVFFHQTGDQDQARFARLYQEQGVRGEVASFFPDLPRKIAASDLVISRAGASTLSEIIGLGTPAIIVPYPHAGGHQLRNAQIFAGEGAVRIIEQREGWESEFKEAVLRLATSPDERRNLREGCARQAFRDAATVIAEKLLSMSRQGTK